MTSNDTKRAEESVNAYLDTVARFEPNIHHMDSSAFYASAAISLKRHADAAERMAVTAEEILVTLRDLVTVTARQG